MYDLKDTPFKNIMMKFEKNVIGKRILHFLIDIGFKDTIYRILNRDYLKKRKEFYNNNIELVEQNIDLLADEKSKEVYKKMIEYRMKRKRKVFPQYTVDNQYFSEDIIKLSSEEVFIDCGAFIGDTVDMFRKKVNDKYKKIVCFEPDEANFIILNNSIKECPNIYVYNMGVYSKECEMKFDAGKSDTSSLNESGSNTIKVINLDNIKDCNDATFIKMDIEGSELEALKGAENIIVNNKPKLAICIYHSEHDMIDIIKYVHELVPDYKLYVRQHSTYESETVLYAVI